MKFTLLCLISVLFVANNAKAQKTTENENPYGYAIAGNFTISDENYNKLLEQPLSKAHLSDGNLNLSELNVAYPNPGDGIYYIDNSGNNITDVNINTENNQLIDAKNIKYNSGKIEIDISKFPSGLYKITYINKASGISYSQTVTKK